MQRNHGVQRFCIGTTGFSPVVVSGVPFRMFRVKGVTLKMNKLVKFKVENHKLFHEIHSLTAFGIYC